MNKIKRFAEVQGAKYKEVQDIATLTSKFVLVQFSDVQIIFNLTKLESVKARHGKYVYFTNEELKFLDMLDFEIGNLHFEELKQNVTDWYGKEKYES
jgi:hypothetical protein